MAHLILPGLVDVHTHLRVPGGEHKEDFATGTAAALAGGVTTVLAMPNTSPPLTTPAVLRATRETAQAAVHCDVGLFAGASPAEIGQLPTLAPYAVALKVYLNDTFGPLRVEDEGTLRTCFETWPADKLIAFHAEEENVDWVIRLVAEYGRPVHFCHISRQGEIEAIAAAKERGLPVTCEVAPHHLFMSAADVEWLGPLGDMRPCLGQPADVAALWAHLNSTVDCIATDHAPHTLDEKYSETPPPGVPGLETSLPLMLTAVHDGRLTLERLIELMATNPRRIFGLPEQPETTVEVDIENEYIITDKVLKTKCGWTPFAGMVVRGRVQRVTLRGRVLFEDGRLLAEARSGRVIP